MANNYESQDFIDTYEELLEFAKKNTKWDPSTSGEADPGVVLIKLIALLKDKLDYKADMSEAQAYLDTVTDRQSAFDLLQMLGYSMKNASSATGQILVSLRSAAPDEVTSLPVFSGITDETNTVSFFTTEEVSLSPLEGQSVESVQKVVNVMEGTLFSIEKEGYDVFSLKDVDESGRFFLQKTGLAQNGVFILDANGNIEQTPWRNIESTNIYPKGKYFFVLSDASGENYIQFPENFEELIGSSSFTVKATFSKGSAGNIKRGTLVKTMQDSAFYNVRQTADISNGSDEEDIQQAVQNYYSNIGVFNTLVTKSDFENAIRFLMKDGRRLFSNSFVKTAFDRRIPIITNSVNKNYKIFESTVENDDPQKIEATCLNYGTDYDSSFFYAQKIQNGEDLELLVNNLLADAKELLSNVVLTTEGRYLAITNLVGNIFVNTTSEIVLSDIKKKLQERIQERFNARNLTFGQKLDYQVLLTLIQGIDNKLAAVALNSPEYQIYSGYDQEAGKLIELTDEEYTDIQAKAVLSGATPLFKFKNKKNSLTDPNNDYLDIGFGSRGLTNISNGQNVIRISGIRIPNNTNKWPDACLLQVCKDALRADVQYGYGVYYKIFQRFNLNETSDLEITKSTILTAGSFIPEGSIIFLADGFTMSESLKQASKKNTGNDGYTLIKDYTVKSVLNLKGATDSVLKAGALAGVGSTVNENSESYIGYIIEDGETFKVPEDLDFTLSSSSGIIKFEAGEMIKPVGITLTAQSVEEYLSTKILGSSENIEHLVVDSAILPDTYYYFLRLNNKTELTLSPNNFYILQDNEYFVYSDNTLESYILLGAGTKLKLPNDATEAVTLTRVINAQLDDTTSSSFARLSAQVETVSTEIQTFKGPLIEGVTIESLGDWKTLSENETLKIKEALTTDDPIATFNGSGNYTYRALLSITSDSKGVAKVPAGVSFTLTVEGKGQLVQGSDVRRLVCSSPFSSLFSENEEQNFLADGEKASLAMFEDASISATGVKTEIKDGVLTIESEGGSSASVPIVKQTENGLIQFRVYVEKMSGAIKIGETGQTWYKNMVSAGAIVSFTEGETCSLEIPVSVLENKESILISGLQNGDKIILSELAQIDGYSDEILYTATDSGVLLNPSTNGYFDRTFSGIENDPIIKAMLALDLKKKFDWSSISEGTLSHPTKPESFFNSEHPYNKQVIPYIMKDLNLLKLHSSFGGR